MGTDDYISRQAAIDALTIQRIQDEKRDRYKKGIDQWLNFAIASLSNIPPADVRPVKRGRWIWNMNGMDWSLGAWCCSECGMKAETWWATSGYRHSPLRFAGSKFCGNCGAEMEADND